MSIQRQLNRRHSAVGKKSTKGSGFRHIIRHMTFGDRVYFLHATKGWRSESRSRQTEAHA